MTLDAEVWAQAKQRYTNVSQLMNETLKGLLAMPENQPITEIKQAKEALAISQAKAAELSIKLKKMEDAKKKEDENVTWV